MINKTDLKMIYFVTPTYPRPEQIPELTRLAHTMMHVPRIHWIVADDQPLCSAQVLNILRLVLNIVPRIVQEKNSFQLPRWNGMA